MSADASLSAEGALAILAAAIENGDAKQGIQYPVPGTQYVVPSTQYSVLCTHLLSQLSRLRELEADFQTALQREKLAAMRELAYGASHEINNPLANIATRAQTLLRDEIDPDRRRALATINVQAFRAHEMIADMMLFAKPPAPVVERFDLATIIDTVLAELAEEARQQGTALERTKTEGPIELTADPVQITVALRALVQNSLQALRAGGRVEIAADASADLVRLRVTDTGPGLSEDARRHLFDPFYSGREAGRGLGLGLSKCWKIVELHGGKMEVSSELGRGTTIAMMLPRAGGQPVKKSGG